MTRKGFVLPTVIVALLIIAALTAALQTSTWNAARQARLGFAGERTLHAADAAVANRIAAWNAHDFAALAIGAREVTTQFISENLNATVTVVRTNTLSAWIEAQATDTRDGTLFTARRRTARSLALAAPPLPLLGAATLLGPTQFDAGAETNGIDQTPASIADDCRGALSDESRDITGLAFTTSPAPSVTTTIGWPPQTQHADSLTLRATFDANWNTWVARTSATQTNATTTLLPQLNGTRCSPGHGEPWRSASAVAPCVNEWGAHVVQPTTPATPVQLIGASRQQGALLINGNLTLTGSLELNGLLVVRGAIDASAGSLTVNGGVVIRDEAGQGSRFGTATRIRYSQCALRRAIAAVATPAPVHSRSWIERP